MKAQPRRAAGADETRGDTGDVRAGGTSQALEALGEYIPPGPRPTTKLKAHPTAQHDNRTGPHQGREQ
ncbi:hypothetical protein Sm713_57440 [Streptomyces sp. TS71-3]|nr:hypothetical protein Sm713_57440 [Streptomyces sp. TS71-3]